MAVTIYKDGTPTNVEPSTLQDHLNAGWSLTKEKVIEPVSVEDIDTNQSGKLSTEEIRRAAQKAGIVDWEKKRMKTLLKELGHGDKED